MATATNKATLETVLDATENITVYGTKETITLTLEEVRQFIATPTKSGKLPSNREIVLFLKTCKARGLNPYQKDVYLIGYDGKDGPKFETVVALPAMLKRAEGNRTYEGKEYGVLVWDKAKGETVEVMGDCVPSTMPIVGGWCRVYRAGRRPEYATANLKAYDKGFGHWSVDKPWMIAKCAIAKSLRQAFPSDVGDLTIVEELGAAEAADSRRGSVSRFTDRLASLVAETERRQRVPVDPMPDRDEPTPDDEGQDPEANGQAEDLDELWQELEAQLADAETLGDLSRIDQHVLPLFPAEARANAKALVDAKHAKMEAKR